MTEPTPATPAPILTPGCIHTIASLAAARTRAKMPGPVAAAASWITEKAYWQRTTPGSHQPRSYIVEGPPKSGLFTVPNIYVDAAATEQTAASKDAWWKAVTPLMSDVDNAVWAALAWQFGSNTADADTAARVLRAWSNVTSIGGHDGPLTFAFLGNGLILAADLISDCADWTPQDRVLFRRMVRDAALPMSFEVIGITKADNWRSAGYAASIMGWHHLGNADGTANATHYGQLLRSHISASIDAHTGKIPLEEQRAKDSVWYTYFSLAAMAMGVRAYRNAIGTDLFHDTVTGPLLQTATHALLKSFQNPLPGKAMPGSTDFWPLDLFEAMAAEWNDPVLRAAVLKRRPINNYGHHILWPSPTLTEATQ